MKKNVCSWWKHAKKSAFHRRDHIVSRIDVLMLHKKFRGFEKYRLSAENPKHDFGFTEKSLFVMKTGQKIVFHSCEAYILSRIVISMLYKKFRHFKKYRVSAKNSNVLAFDFTKNGLFTIKTDRKSVYHPCETHILARLDITVLYIFFFMF
jgi:hypothetical protein